MESKVILLVLISGCLCISDDHFICDEETSLDISDGTHLINGNILFNGVTYKRSEYIYDNTTGVYRGCICAKQKCIRKCCPHGFGYHATKKICVETNVKYDPPVWDEYKYIPNANASKLFKFVFGILNCSGEVKTRIGKATKYYHLVKDGTLYLELPNAIPPWMVRPPDKYCLDTFVFEDASTGEKTTKVDALICFSENQDEDNNHYVLSSSCMLISCFFILATLAVYAWLPELRNLHGRVLMVYLVCLFVAFVGSATMQILLYIDSISLGCCVVLTFIIYFCLLAAFFWLNVMSFDIWWTFSGKRGMTLEKLSARGRFLAYSMYAFGVPTLLTTLMAGLEFSGLPLNPFLPMLRHQGCFLNGTSKLLYLYGPMMLVVMSNLIFFVLTALKIAQITQQTSVLKSKDSSTHDQHRNDKQRLLLYVKLFTIMGINWILEVVSALYPKYKYVWSFTDAYNILIGVFVFIIFVCKRKIFRLIKKRIKERFHQQINNNTEMKSIHRDVSRWKVSQNQRFSRETIKTIVATDVDSVSLNNKAV